MKPLAEAGAEGEVASEVILGEGGGGGGGGGVSFAFPDVTAQLPLAAAGFQFPPS